MKRIIIALISLALSVSIYAQEITGKWNQTHQGSENGSEMMTSETLSFMKNSTFEDVVTLEMKYVDDKNAQAPKFFLNVLSKSVVSEFKKHSKKPIRCNVVSLTSDKLQLLEVGAKDSETETYTRAE